MQHYSDSNSDPFGAGAEVCHAYCVLRVAFKQLLWGISIFTTCQQSRLEEDVEADEEYDVTHMIRRPYYITVVFDADLINKTLFQSVLYMPFCPTLGANGTPANDHVQCSTDAAVPYSILAQDCRVPQSRDNILRQRVIPLPRYHYRF